MMSSCPDKQHRRKIPQETIGGDQEGTSGARSPGDDDVCPTPAPLAEVQPSPAVSPGPEPPQATPTQVWSGRLRST